MISFYHIHDFLFRSIGDEKLTNISFYVQCFYKVLLPTVNATKLYYILDYLNIGEWF